MNIIGFIYLIKGYDGICDDYDIYFVLFLFKRILNFLNLMRLIDG